MAGFTNWGKQYVLDQYFRNAGELTTVNLRLITAAVAPTPDHATMGTAPALVEIANSTDYVRGQPTGNPGFLTRGTTDFDVSGPPNDTSDYGFVQIKDITFNANTAAIPASGAAARYAILTTSSATDGTSNVICFWNLGSDRVVAQGQSLTLQNLEMRGTEV